MVTPNDDVTLKKKKEGKQSESMPSIVITTTISTNTTVTAKTVPPTTSFETTAIIELIPDQNAMALLLSLPVQTTKPLQTIEDNVVPLSFTRESTVWISSLDIQPIGTPELLSSNNTSSLENIPEIAIDASQNISFERYEEPIIFSRDEELEELNENVLMAKQLQTVEQTRLQYRNSRPQPQFPNLPASTSNWKS